VRLVLTAAITELLELETPSGRLFVLRRRVVALLALGALQCDNFPHLLPFGKEVKKLSSGIVNQQGSPSISPVHFFTLSLLH
jgi:hypothetical protein